MIFHVISWNWDFPVICVVWHKCFRHCCCHRSLSVSLMPGLVMAKSVAKSGVLFVHASSYTAMRVLTFQRSKCDADVLVTASLWRVDSSLPPSCARVVLGFTTRTVGVCDVRYMSNTTRKILVYVLPLFTIMRWKCLAFNIW